MARPDGQKSPNSETSTAVSDGLDPDEITKDLEEKVPSIRKVPELDRTRIVNMVVEKTATFSGPLPPPAMLKAYNDVEPGIAGRIVAMAESSLAHDQTIQSKILEAEVLASKADHTYRLTGMHSARLALFGMLLLVGWLAYVNQPWLAGLFGASSMAMIVWMFIRGQSEAVADKPAMPRIPDKPDKKTKKRR
jgi:uncharacterized membrane protein